MLDVPKSGETDEIAVKVRMKQREDEHRQHRHLHLERLDLLAEVLRGPADHQAGDEHRQDDVDQHAVHPGPDAAEDHLAQLDVRQRHEPAERRERVVPAVDGAAARVGRHGREERRVGDAEADFLAFHVAAGRHAPSPSGRRRPPSASGSRALRPSTPTVTPARKRNAIARPHRPAVSPRSGHRSERVGEARRDGEDAEHRQEVRQRRRVLERVRAVGVEEAAAVGAELLDDLLRRHRPLRDRLLGHDARAAASRLRQSS